MKEIREEILKLVAKVEASIPSELLPDLPPSPNTMDAPMWYRFENYIWMRGEDIRQLLIENKTLRRDIELQKAFLSIACNQKAKRGRQSFIMLLGNTGCLQFAPNIASQLSDPDVVGHAIDTLTKMRCPDYVEAIKPFTNDKTTWIRNKAKHYVEQYKKSD
jgi:hypothetical protein